jgi:hypothetical protein
MFKMIRQHSATLDLIGKSLSEKTLETIAGSGSSRANPVTLNGMSEMHPPHPL